MADRRTATVIAALGLAGAAVGAALARAGGVPGLLRRAKSVPGGLAESVPLPGRDERGSTGPEADAVRQWSCACGQAYRVTGEGRHVVHWPADAPESEPVLDGRCVSCERPLPGEHVIDEDDEDRDGDTGRAERADAAQSAS